jgi:hypothetical protein
MKVRNTMTKPRVKSVNTGDKRIISSFTSIADLERVFGVGNVLASIMENGIPSVKTLDELKIDDIPNAVFFVYNK